VSSARFNVGTFSASCDYLRDICQRHARVLFYAWCSPYT